MAGCRALLLAVCLSGLADGQVTVGRITGTITDQSGAAIVGIPVIGEEVSTGARSIAVTQENGSYVFTSLPPGSYTLRVEKEGFTSVHQTGIVLDAASSAS